MDINTWRYNQEHSRSGAMGEIASKVRVQGALRFEDARLPARHNVKSLLPVTQVFARLSCVSFVYSGRRGSG
jgi:hypothetical protein